MAIVEKRVKDNAQCPAAISNEREVSGLDGKILAQSTRNDTNFIPVTAAKIIMKVKLKKMVNLANFLTLLD